MSVLKRNYKVIIGIIIGVVLTGSITSAASISSSDVEYSNTSSGLSSTNVQGVLDELNTKATTLNSNLEKYKKQDNSELIDFGFQTNTTKTVIANSTGVCIARNGKMNCFKRDNWEVEKTHIQSVFSDVNCDVNSSNVSCYASDFGCYVSSGGYVICSDAGGTYCEVYSDGSVNCY